MFVSDNTREDNNKLPGTCCKLPAGATGNNLRY